MKASTLVLRQWKVVVRCSSHGVSLVNSLIQTGSLCNLPLFHTFPYRLQDTSTDLEKSSPSTLFVGFNTIIASTFASSQTILTADMFYSAPLETQCHASCVCSIHMAVLLIKSVTCNGLAVSQTRITNPSMLFGRPSHSQNIFHLTQSPRINVWAPWSTISISRPGFRPHMFSPCTSLTNLDGTHRTSTEVHRVSVSLRVFYNGANDDFRLTFTVALAPTLIAVNTPPFPTALPFGQARLFSNAFVDASESPYPRLFPERCIIVISAALVP